jgi:hypothetical protein
MDFKVRALDFLSIYVKQMQSEGKSSSSGTQMTLIQGLLKALTVAHNDKNTTLFDRIKSVLAMIAKQSSSAQSIEESKKAGEGKECKILLTEMMAMILRQHKDAGLSKAYSDSFIVLTKHFWEDAAQKEFLIFTYKELLKKFLSGRCANGSGLNQKFFQNVVEQCPQLGWALAKPLLSCFLMKEKEGDGSRGNHQRLQAVEIFGSLIRASTSPESQDLLAKELELMTSVIVKVIQTADSWEKKKV